MWSALSKALTGWLANLVIRGPELGQNPEDGDPKNERYRQLRSTGAKLAASEISEMLVDARS